MMMRARLLCLRLAPKHATGGASVTAARLSRLLAHRDGAARRCPFD
jgi:hypothetical protein